jgi:Na+/H+ antiporter NhaC
MENKSYQPIRIEEMTQEEINQEIKNLDSQLNKLLMIIITFVLSFIIVMVLIILGTVSFNLLTVGVLAIFAFGSNSKC